MPSLGISLLKAELQERGISAEINYLCLRFVERIGYRLYQEISQGTIGLLGEWIFQPALFGAPSDEQVDAFWRSEFDAKPPRVLGEDPERARRRVASLQKEAIAFIDAVAAEYRWSQYKIVGFTTLFQQDLASLALARRIKEQDPESIILFGGPNCEAEMGFGLAQQFPFVDAVFSGEADQTFPQFVESCLRGDPPPAADGVIRRDPETGDPIAPTRWVAPVADLDTTPIPDFDDYFDQLPTVGHRVQPHICFETARGCWWGEKHHCTFCGLNGSTMAFRSKSPERALDEISHLTARYGENHGVTLLRSVDQILDQRYFKTVVPGLAKRKLPFPIYYEIKTNLTRAQVRLLAAANVKLLQPGIESLSTPVLRLMRKGCTMLQNVLLLKWCAEEGVVALWNLLYGFPGESAEDYDRMVEVISTVSHLQAPRNTYRVRLVRFSPYIADPESFGMTQVRPNATYRSLYPGISEEILAQRAFRFDFDFADGRDLDYCRETLDATRQWMGSSGGEALVGFSSDDGVLIWDERRDARDRWAWLEPRLGRVLSICDRIQSLPKIRKLISEEERREVTLEETEELLRTLQARRLLLEDEGKFLSVVVRNDTAPPPRPSRDPSVPVVASGV